MRVREVIRTKEVYIEIEGFGLTFRYDMDKGKVRCVGRACLYKSRTFEPVYAPKHVFLPAFRTAHAIFLGVIKRKKVMVATEPKNQLMLPF